MEMPPESKVTPLPTSATGLSSLLPPLYSSEISLAESAIDSYRKEATVRFIIGELDVESDWDAYLMELEKAGLTRWLELYQQGYDAQFK